MPERSFYARYIRKYRRGRNKFEFVRQHNTAAAAVGRLLEDYICRVVKGSHRRRTKPQRGRIYYFCIDPHMLRITSHYVCILHTRDITRYL